MPEVVAGDLERMLVCRASYAGYPDAIFYTAPDLDVEMSLNKRWTLIAHGPEDQHAAYISAPLVKIAADNPVSIHLYDRDNVSRDDLGESRFPRSAKLPLQYKNGDTTIECRGLDRAAVEAAFATYLQAADHALDALSDALTSSSSVSLNEADLGFGGHFKPRRWRITSLASFVGWSDPRVIRRVNWVERLETRFAQIAAPIVTKIAATASSKGGWTDAFDMKVETVALDAVCGINARKRYAPLLKRLGAKAPYSPCVYRVSIHPVGDSGLWLDVQFQRISLVTEVAVAFENGVINTPMLADLEEAARIPGQDSSGRVEAGQTKVALFVGTNEVDTSDPGMQPRLFIVHRVVSINEKPSMMRIP